MFSGIINGLMFIIAAITRNPLIGVIAIILGAGFGLTRKPLLINYMNKYIDSHHRATTLSIISMLQRIGSIIINPLVGMMATKSLLITLIILGSSSIIFSLFTKIKEEHLID